MFYTAKREAGSQVQRGKAVHGAPQCLSLIHISGQKLLVHVFNFEIRQVAVLQRMADDLARIRSVDVAVDDLIVLDDHDAVAVALQEGAQLIACLLYTSQQGHTSERCSCAKGMHRLESPAFSFIISSQARSPHHMVLM